MPVLQCSTVYFAEVHMLERAREGTGSAPKAQAPLGRMVGPSRGVIMFSYRYIRYFVTALRWPFEHRTTLKLKSPHRGRENLPDGRQRAAVRPGGHPDMHLRVGDSGA